MRYREPFYALSYDAWENGLIFVVHTPVVMNPSWKVQEYAELHDRLHVYHIYSVFHSERNKLQDVLQKAGIHTGMHYPIPVHLQKPYQCLGYHEGDFPVTEKIASEQLSLPMFPELKEEDVSRVSEAVCNCSA